MESPKVEKAEVVRRTGRAKGAEDVLDAVTRVINEPEFKAGASRVSESFKSCGGAAEAKGFLEMIAAQ